MRILITGASGFIGSHTVDEARSRGLEVVSFDRAVGETERGRGEVFLGDITDYHAVREAVNHADYAINLAGILGTQETINDPIPSIQVNTIGALNFFKACIPTKFHQVKAVQIGVGNYWMNNSYSISKNSAVRFSQMYNKEHGTKIAAVRALNAYGPGQKTKPVRKIIPTFIMRALRNEDIEIYGDGEQVMDMIYVKDLARILVDAAVLDHGNYTTPFEAGTSRHTTVNWIAEKVIEASGSKSKVVHSPMRPGEDRGAVVVADPETLEPLGYQDMALFEDKIVDTIKWYKENHEV
jgi:UDP-glucose 4-epimerase